MTLPYGNRATLIGGALRLAARVDVGEDELLRPVRYLEGECRKAGVRIDLGAYATPETLRTGRLDTIVLAAGAAFARVPGVTPCLPEELIARGKIPGKRVLIVGGDGVGLACAVYLLRTGEYEVTIVEESGRLGTDVSPFYLWRYLKLFKERGVSLLTRATPSGWASNRVSVASAKGDRVVEFDGIITTLRESRGELKRSFGDSAPEVFLIGDAKRPRRLHNAIHDAYRMGIQV